MRTPYRHKILCILRGKFICQILIFKKIKRFNELSIEITELEKIRIRPRTQEEKKFFLKAEITEIKKKKKL